MTALSLHNEYAVLRERYLTDLTTDALFLTKEVPEDDFPPF
jgi:hypothetical protein